MLTGVPLPLNVQLRLTFVRLRASMKNGWFGSGIKPSVQFNNKGYSWQQELEENFMLLDA